MVGNTRVNRGQGEKKTKHRSIGKMGIGRRRKTESPKT